VLYKLAFSGYDYESLVPIHGQWIKNGRTARKSYYMKYGKLDLGQIEAIANNLGGMQGVIDFLSGKTMVVHKIWKTIKIGTYRNAKDMYKNLRENFPGAYFDVPTLWVSPDEKEIHLVKVRVSDLFGGKNGDNFSYKKICAAGVRAGLKLCPNEVAPQLCMQYLGQPDGEDLRIAMNPICCSTDEKQNHPNNYYSVQQREPYSQSIVVMVSIDRHAGQNDFFEISGKALFIFCRDLV